MPSCTLAAAMLAATLAQTPAPQPQAIEPAILNPPLSGFVIDARGALARFGQRPVTAAALGATADELPGPGLGINAGAHVYPFRIGRVTVGFGAEMVLASRGRQPLDSAGEPEGPKLKARLFGWSPQISLNFGHRNGWSYASGGIGRAAFETWPDDEDRPDRSVRAINYGGGARWFRSRHVAFTIDMRFYAIAPGVAEGAVAERPRTRLFVLSAGVSLR